MSEPRAPDGSDWRDETQADAAAMKEEHTDPGVVPAPEKVVLVALDFSAPGLAALAWALDHAAAIGASLHVVHVIDRRWRLADLTSDPATLAGELAQVERAAAGELRRLTEEARARLAGVHEHVAVGRPADEIVRLAHDLAAQTVVVGSHGHDAISHLLVGSVAERVVRTATCNVMVVKI
jgi:nucleotide-binding universal stress UspA family protein